MQAPVELELVVVDGAVYYTGYKHFQLLCFSKDNNKF